MSGRVKLKIDLGKLTENFATLRRKVAPCRVLAVVKADAYGLGVVPIAETLKNAGADLFGVATVAESRELIQFGLPVQILGALTAEEIPEAVKFGLICPAGSFDEAKAISDEAVKQRKNIPISFIVDSGMGRLGFPADRALTEIIKASKLPNLRLQGLYTHLSSAAMLDDDYTAKQISIFKDLAGRLSGEGLVFPDIHIAASDAVNFFPESMEKPFNLVRIGLIMSCYDSKLAGELSALDDILEVTSTLIACRKLVAGSAIGYRRTHILTQDTLVGTIPAGYADGVPVAISNRGLVLVNGVPCPIIGRVSMDYTMISLENVPNAKPGDEVVLIGKRGENEITVDDWSKFKGTFNHEILCALSKRLDRIYLK